MDQCLDRNRIEMRKARFPAWLGRSLLWVLPLAFLAIFFYLPLATILRTAFGGDAPGGGEIYLAGIVAPLRFTLWQAGLSTLLTMALGLPAAYLFGRLDFRGKRALRVLVTLPFLLPTVVVAAGFFALFGANGWVNQVLMSLFNVAQPPVNLTGTLGAILLAHVFYNTSVVIRVVGSAWAQLDPRLEQAGRTLGASPWQTFKEITLPLLRPSIIAAMLLVFLFNFTSFGVILMLGGPGFATLEVEIYYQTMNLLNLPQAGLLSVIQLGFTLGITWLASRAGGSEGLNLMPRFQGEGLHAARGAGEKAFLVAMVILLVLILVTPLAALGVRSFTQIDRSGEQTTATFTTTYYAALFQNPRGSLFHVPPVQAAVNSLSFALLTVLIALPLGMLAAYGLNHRSRLMPFLEGMVMLPLGASAVTLGLGYLLVFNKPPLDIRSFPLLIPLAHSLVAFPFVLRVLRPAIQSIPIALRESAAVLGAPPARTWLEVDLPLLRRPILAGAIYAFTISLGEFGATSFLARPEMPTLPVAIFRFFSMPGALNYGQALAMAVLLLALCAVALALLEWAAP
jgi:thiamine transport system permease protein